VAKISGLNDTKTETLTAAKISRFHDSLLLNDKHTQAMTVFRMLHVRPLEKCAGKVSLPTVQTSCPPAPKQSFQFLIAQRV
jgi:hypothetical protein